MAQKEEMTREEAIYQVAAELDGPIALTAFVERVLQIKPSQAKNPQAAIRQLVRDTQGKSGIFTDEDTILPMRLALTGVKFRVTPSPDELKAGILLVSPTFDHFVPQMTAAEQIQFVDVDDHVIPAEVTAVTTTSKSIFGNLSYQADALNLGWWFRKMRLSRQDHILVTLLDYQSHKFRLQPEPHHENRGHRKEIAAANQQLADMLFALLENDREERAWAQMIVPTAYYRLKDSSLYPADHWLAVVKEDKRMKSDGVTFTYSDNFSPLEQILAGAQPRPSRPPKLSRQQRQQIYRFHVAYKHRKGLWRRIEIQGSQTLSDFNRYLVGEFNHDFDHMAGFWKLVRRGQTKNYREIEIATIDPFGGGDGANTKIAALEMQPGDKMKYVFDFGDWHEYRIELEAITEPESATTKEVNYPRVVAQNRPSYRYCTDCAEEGRKTVATYFCYECAEMLGEPVYVCEAHASPDHDDHYLKELVH